jgi:hypothetical protein
MPKFNVVEHRNPSGDCWVIKAFWRNGCEELLAGVYISPEAARESLAQVTARWLQSSQADVHLVKAG